MRPGGTLALVEAREADVVVVGLGPGGESISKRLAKAGLEVVGVESHLVGGECPFYGCVPSKVMTRAAYSVAESRRMPVVAGSSVTQPDWRVVAERIREEITHDWDDKTKVEGLEDAGVQVVRGHGRLTAPRQVEVDTDAGILGLTARRAVVMCPGAAAYVPDIAGLDDTPFWTNREAVQVQELPASLIVLGGGPMAVEFAQTFARFDVDVTVLEPAERIIVSEEPESSRVVGQILAREGVRVMPDSMPVSVSYDDGRFTVDLGDEEVSADKLLLCGARVPRTEGLGFDTVGVSPTEEGTLPTDGFMRVLVEGEPLDWLYAIGDITGNGSYTHSALYQASVACKHMQGNPCPEADFRVMPRVTFTDPEVGSVGLTEAEAREQGLDVRIGYVDLGVTPRGQLHETGNQGFVKVIAVDDQLVGATSVGPVGGEVLSMLSTAMHARIPVETLRSMIYPYPTFHDAVRRALLDLD